MLTPAAVSYNFPDYIGKADRWLPKCDPFTDPRHNPAIPIFIRAMTQISSYGTYHFGSDVPLSDIQLDRLSRIFSQPPPEASSVLGGRCSVSFHHIHGLGRVVVKQYTRGGLIRHLIAREYLRWGKTRSRMEYEILQNVSRLGVSVPEPLVYAYRGRLFYQAWLVTREIPKSLTLARLSLDDEMRARLVMVPTIEQVSMLIANSVLHVDLHPGNVVVDYDNRVFLLDFDKSRLWRKSREKLKAHYLARWRRAVAKHRLPGILDELLRAGLS